MWPSNVECWTCKHSDECGNSSLLCPGGSCSLTHFTHFTLYLKVTETVGRLRKKGKCIEEGTSHSSSNGISTFNHSLSSKCILSACGKGCLFLVLKATTRICRYRFFLFFNLFILVSSFYLSKDQSAELRLNNLSLVWCRFFKFLEL